MEVLGKLGSLRKAKELQANWEINCSVFKID